MAVAVTQIEAVEFRRCYDYAEFMSARNGGDRNSYLSPLSESEFSSGYSYLSDDGAIGYRIVDGDLQSVFNNSAIRGAGKAAVLDAIRNGARTLDCFDGFLPSYYRQFGFVEVKREAFNPDYAPADWDYERDGMPDVVFMRYHGGNPANLEYRMVIGARF